MYKLTRDREKEREIERAFFEKIKFLNSMKKKKEIFELHISSFFFRVNEICIICVQ